MMDSFIKFNDVIFIAVLGYISYIDIKTLKISNKFIYFLVAAISLYDLFWSLNYGVYYLLLSFSFLIINGVILLLIALSYKGGFGGGDIKLGACIGLYLADFRAVEALCISFFLGGIAAMIIICLCYETEKYSILKSLKVPFAPFLCVGTALVVFYPQEVYSLWHVLGW